MCWHQLKNRCWVGLVVIPVPTEKISEYPHCLLTLKIFMIYLANKNKKDVAKPQAKSEVEETGGKGLKNVFEVLLQCKQHDGRTHKQGLKKCSCSVFFCCNANSMPGEHTNKHLTSCAKIWFSCCVGVYPDSCTLAWFLVSKPFSSITVSCILFSESLTVKVRTATKGRSNACHLKMNMQDQSQSS